jgi:hypothetical protein
MDAAARAELAALRRRAYSRDADIAGDWLALERLTELERIALPGPEAAPVPLRPADATEAEASASDPVTCAGPAAVGLAHGRPSPRRRLFVGLLATVAVLAAALGVIPGLEAVADPTRAAGTASPAPRPATNDPVTIPLLIDRQRGEFIDFSARPDVPMYLANDSTTWVQPLGIHYGWALWVAGVLRAQGTQHCLLLTDGIATEAQCTPLEATAVGVLEVSLAHGRLTEYQRPRAMTPDQRVTFEWGGGAYVTMEFTDSPRPG